MGIGIQICGLNGCGKSTLGKALAEKIDFHFIDNENLYFAVNSAKEMVVENKDFQLLNASTQQHIYLKANGVAKYHLKFYDYTGNMIKEMEDISLEEPVQIDQGVMLIRGKGTLSL